MGKISFAGQLGLEATGAGGAEDGACRCSTVFLDGLPHNYFDH